MRDGVQVIVNTAEFRAELAKLAERVRNAAGRKAVGEAAKVMVRPARRLAPRMRKSRKVNGRRRLANPQRTAGALRRGIMAKRGKSRRGWVRAYVTVGYGKGRPKNADPFYWGFLERGWYPRGPGRKLRGGASSRTAARRLAASKGAAMVKRPFLKPAYEQSQGLMMAKFAEVMTLELAKIDARERQKSQKKRARRAAGLRR